MSSQLNDPELQVVAVVLIAAIGLALGLALGVGIHQARSGVSFAPAPVVGGPAVQAAAPTPVAVADDASVVVDNGVVKFYFASGQADLAPGALNALGEAISAAKAGKRLVLSGFHDATGNPAMNAELAKQRALSVRAVLLGAGVAESRLELKKPEAMPDMTDSNAEARRVEVTIAD
ncbi:MAG: OmpA family protein [Hydrogenophaga sp.]|uniref:OmpA family protein n=1 Tax=Hydrogenophaga sp. TaxID=1904254 RepID=UPI00274C0B91|nr:OmpA family protein [Hydrogenophaga sp.]MDP2417348.1 OmpA family protein [Hydrogenophaga sp.]MDZ4190023.1 OmpA family protein [Hydrogenophaga sp.]